MSSLLLPLAVIIICGFLGKQIFFTLMGLLLLTMVFGDWMIVVVPVGCVLYWVIKKLEPLIDGVSINRPE